MHKLDSVKAAVLVQACVHFTRITAVRWTRLVSLSLLVKQLNVINPAVADLCHRHRFVRCEGSFSRQAHRRKIVKLVTK